MVSADGRLFVIDRFINSKLREDRRIDCHDPESNSWKEITKIPLEKLSEVPHISFEYMVNTYFSMRVLKTHDFLEQALLSEEGSARSAKGPLNVGKRKCTIT